MWLRSFKYILANWDPHAEEETMFLVSSIQGQGRLKSVAQHVADPCAQNTAKPASHATNAMNEPGIHVHYCELCSHSIFSFATSLFCSLYFIITVFMFHFSCCCQQNDTNMVVLSS